MFTSETIFATTISLIQPSCSMIKRKGHETTYTLPNFQISFMKIHLAQQSTETYKSYFVLKSNITCNSPYIKTLFTPA